MAAARRVVEMGRAARNAAAVKTRQPLAEVVVAAARRPSARPSSGCATSCSTSSTPRTLRFAGDGGELVAYTVKPNLPVLGPRLGKQLGAVREALAAADAAALVAALRAGEGAAAV